MIRCEDKVMYLCERTATNAAYLINLRNRDDPTQDLQTPYLCRSCGDWHLTTNPTMPDGLPARRSSVPSAASTSTSASAKRSRPGIGSRLRLALGISSCPPGSSVAAVTTNGAAISFEWAGSTAISTSRTT